MKSNAVRNAGVALILFTCLWLAGCSTPYAKVNLKPFPDTAEDSEIIWSDDPDIQEALSIIDSVLTKNGYFTQAAWTSGGNARSNTSTGWSREKTYIHEKPSVYVMVFNEGFKPPTTELKAGKRSVQISVNFDETDRWFLKIRSEVTRVRDEIAAELAKRFGPEKVTTETGSVMMQELM